VESVNWICDLHPFLSKRYFVMHYHFAFLHLVLKLRMSGVIPLLCPYALMAYVGMTFHIVLIYL